MREEILKKITQLQNEIGRLEIELKGYIQDDYASDPIKYNIDKRKWEIEELLKPIREEIISIEEEKSRRIEIATKEMEEKIAEQEEKIAEEEERIVRLETELKDYANDQYASDPIKYNIDKIKWNIDEIKSNIENLREELVLKIENINQEYEIEKNDLLNQIEKTGIDLEEYELKEKEKKEEILEEEQLEEKEETEANKESEIKEEKTEKSETDEIQKESQTKIVNPILANKNLNRQEKAVNISEAKSKKEIRVKQKDEDIDKYIIDLDNDEELKQLQKRNKLLQENDLSNDSVKIYYNAKKDVYIVENVNQKTPKIIKRKKLKQIDRKELAEKLGKDIYNIDTNIYQILLEYDEQYKTNKANEYIDTISARGKSKEQRQNEMKEHQIKIVYNLKGIFSKHETGFEEYEDNFTKEERQELLRLSNSAKTKGVATVTKGFYITIIEKINNITNYFGNRIKKLTSKNEKPALKEGNKVIKGKDSKEQENYDMELQENEKISENAENMKRAQEKVKNDPLLQKEIQEATTCTSKGNAEWANQFAVELQARRQKFNEGMKQEPNVDDVLEVLKTQGFKQVDKDGNEIEK